MELRLGLSLANGGGGNWNIDHLPNLKLWLSAFKDSYTDGDSVPTAKDFSGLGNDATQGTASKQPLCHRYSSEIVSRVRNNQALVFDGVDDVVKAPLSSYVSSTKAYSIRTMIYVEDSSSTTPLMQNAQSGTDRNGLVIATNGLTVFNYSGTYTGVKDLNFLNDFLGKWVEIVATYDGIGGYNLYVDGVKRTTVSDNSYAQGNNDFLYIGAQAGSVAYGKYRQKVFQIYSKELSQLEVSSLFSGDSVSGVVREYLFEENTLDTSGNGNDGTITGATFEKQAILPASFVPDGVDDELIIPNIQTPNGVQFITAFQYKSSGAREMIVALKGNILFNIFAGDFVGITLEGNWDVIGTTPLMDGEHYIISASYDYNTVNIYINGVLELSTPKVRAVQTTTSAYLFSYGGGFYSRSKYMEIDLCEILSDTERQKVETYLSQLTGITLP